MSLDLNELRELLAAINQTDIAELTLKSSDFELTVRRGVRVEEQSYLLDSIRLQGSEASSARGARTSLPATSGSPSLSDGVPEINYVPTAPSVPPPTSDRRFIEIVSPMVGTFYRSPSPDDPPFVEVGDRIRKGQTVCIIEAMKLMNELEAEVGGEIVEILVQNGTSVEYGQLLMKVNPD
ncbi:acetyl-CoA carboxylase biotin carboxyl carrier protein [Kovacikia minuta CCNUW1]|uniref:acetyl-CoA carboxylase biotin carboxyl carrier protein n=1 Tax=Kovacikia minuta TaxID=2931930 RepID=UPI001CCB7E2F|nr:acetyl-CoA carboxylase biotin carboxyl carrier protein [Kovacikia minuta]UBF27521.1 acetyl-CoA carboxylase biotin carboxyl carrier protein [Kovacikia minuta CCNUW1]